MHVEHAIDQMEKLYSTITGAPAPRPEQTSPQFGTEEEAVAQVNRQMDQLLGALQSLPLGQGVPAWNPPLAVWENEQELLIRLDVAGVSKEEIDISVNGNLLSVVGRRQAGDRLLGYQPRHVESRCGIFQRVLTLPPGLVSTEFNSRLVDGILEITIRKEGARLNRAQSMPAMHSQPGPNNAGTKKKDVQ